MPHINEILFLITPYIRKIKSRLTATSKTFMRIIKYQSSIHFNFKFTLFLIPTFYLSNQSYTHNIYVCVELCRYTYLSAHVCRFTCSCVHMHLEAIGQYQVTSSIFFYFIFETQSLSEPGSHHYNQAGWTATPKSVLFWCWDCKHVTTPGFLPNHLSSNHLNSDLHVCTANSLPIELSLLLPSL